MKKIKRNNKKIIIFIIVSIILLIYLIYTVYNLAIKPTETFIVENGSLSSEETLQGYIIRDETILKGDNYKNGLVPIKAEGEKVAKGEAVFRYYTSGEDELIKKISELDTKIQETWDNENEILSADIKLIDEQIESKLDELYHANDLQKIKEYKNDLSTYLTKKAKIVGDLSPSGSYLKQLVEERSKYENQLNSGSEYLTATRSGVVSYRVDGLEETLMPSNFASLSKSMLEGLNLKTSQIISTSVESGKVIDNFTCYIACVMDNNAITENKIKQNSSLTLRLPNNEEITSKIVYLTQESDKESIVVFQVDKYVEQLISYRKISFDIIWWSATGWKVPNESIKYENDDLVYVIRKRVGYTDKIYVKVLKQGEKYSIITNYDTGKELLEKGVSEDTVENRRKLSLYDEIQL